MFKSLAFVALFAVSALAQSLTINTPSGVVECEPVLISWTGGTAPYYLSVLPGGQPGAAALENIGQQNGTSYTWNVDFTAGSSLGLTLRDSTGQTAQSAPFTVQGGSDTSCASQSAGSGGASATGSSAGSSSTGSSGASTTAAASASSGGSSATSGSSAADSSSTSSSSSSAAAPTNVVQLGAAGIVGAVVAAILA